VYGTGFQATSPVPVGMILGRQGQDLTEAWRAGPEAYLGTTVAGFPNMFMLMGPNTGLGHNSVVYMIESQISYVLGCLATMQEQELRSVEVRPEVQAAFNSDLQAEFEGSVWTSGCKSWYLHESGKNTTLWPGMSYQFRRRMKHFRLSDFRWEAEEHKAV
jgi:cation diffusion facilitator CzcD-associated flavoprotein CzcO